MYRWTRNKQELLNENKAEAFTAFKRIAQTRTSASVGGVKVDPVIATAVVTAHGKLSDTHAPSLAAMPAEALAQFGQSLIKNGLHQEAVNECFSELLGEEEDSYSSSVPFSRPNVKHEAHSIGQSHEYFRLPTDPAEDPYGKQHDFPHADFGMLTMHTDNAEVAHALAAQDPDHPHYKGEHVQEGKASNSFLSMDSIAGLEEAARRPLTGPEMARANKSRAAAQAQIQGNPDAKKKKATISYTPQGKKNVVDFGADPKTAKGQSKNFLTGINYMMPHTSSGLKTVSGKLYNLCANASAGCSAACLHTAGDPRRMEGKIGKRMRKTEQYKDDRKSFVAALHKQIAMTFDWMKGKNKNTGLDRAPKNMKLAIRLNGTSDIGWHGTSHHTEGKSLMDHFDGKGGRRRVQFYDYTKNKTVAKNHREGKLPENYHITYSRDETPESDAFAMDHISNGGTAAIVMRGVSPKTGLPCQHKGSCGCLLPATYKGHPVINGDKHDHRFLDKKENGLAKHEGAWVGLKAKGDAMTDVTGFVVHDPHLHP